MVTRNINRPAYALALLFAIVAVADAANALTSMQTTRSGGNAGWVIDLVAAGISAAFATVLLMRPHVYAFGAATVWALVAFVVNFALRQPDSVDTIATYRMVIYFLVFVAAVVLVVAELWERAEPQRVAGRGFRPWQPSYGQPGAPAPYPPSAMGPMAVPMAMNGPAVPMAPPVQGPAPAPAPAPFAPPPPYAGPAPSTPPAQAPAAPAAPAPAAPVAPAVPEEPASSVDEPAPMESEPGALRPEPPKFE
jgi:hypothetical protein